MQESRDYLSKEHLNLYLMLEKVRRDYSEIDFDHVRLFYANTRKEHETLKYLRKVNRVAGVIRARDEFPEIHLTHRYSDVSLVRHRSLFRMGSTEPYDINIDEDDQVLRCTISDLQTHDTIRDWYFWMYWNRFIEGRPNRMLMKLVVEDEKQCEGVLRGGHLRIIEHDVWCDVYSTPYPRSLSCHVNDVLPGKDYKIGDLRKDLPDNVKLAKNYSSTMSLIACDNNVMSGIADSFYDGHFDASRWHDIDMTRMRVPIDEAKIAESAKHREALLTSSELAQMQKVAKHLGKDFEVVKRELMAVREQERRAKKAQEEKKKLEGDDKNPAAAPPSEEEKKK